jgi:hypothetical protein
LSQIAASYAVPGDAIEVVASILNWCREHNVPEDNPFRSGKALRCNETGKPLILLADEITPSMHSSVLAAMELRGFVEEIECIREPHAFLSHLMLHELAHVQFPEASERECDEWAFSMLAHHAG